MQNPVNTPEKIGEPKKRGIYAKPRKYPGKNRRTNIFISLIRYDFQIAALVPRRKLEIHEIKTLLVLW